MLTFYLSNEQQGVEDSRMITVDGQEYRITVQPDGRTSDGALHAVVLLPGVWQATVPLPVGVTSLNRLWYRELLELVRRATVIAAGNGLTPRQ